MNIPHVLFRYTGSLDAFRSILKTEGVTGLWKGWSPNCQRAALVCLGGKISSRLNCLTLKLGAMSLRFHVISLLMPTTDLTTYDSVKQSILRHTNLSDNAFVHTLSRYVCYTSCITITWYVYIASWNISVFFISIILYYTGLSILAGNFCGVPYFKNFSPCGTFVEGWINSTKRPISRVYIPRNVIKL